MPWRAVLQTLKNHHVLFLGACMKSLLDEVPTKSAENAHFWILCVDSRLLQDRTRGTRDPIRSKQLKQLLGESGKGVATSFCPGGSLRDA